MEFEWNRWIWKKLFVTAGDIFIFEIQVECEDSSSHFFSFY